jgi:tetracycline 7-halogenase / FADH2 O2-dependent halogenase
MTQLRCGVAVVGSGFAGSLLARILAKLRYDVVLLERGAHPRFAIGESSTPMANLTLERIGTRYGLEDCIDLATHGRWLARRPELMRGRKRGFTFYRHHPDEEFADRGLDSERLLVAASPDDAIADTHWLRADVDHHFVREAVAAGVEYRDCVELTGATFDDGGALLTGHSHDGSAIEVRARFVVDASGPGGFLAKQLAIPSTLDRTRTRAGLVFSHFDDVALMADAMPELPPGPYPDDWAATHHILDEGWMYSLRFDDGVTSAGILLSPNRGRALAASSADEMWRTVLDRYPTLARLFAGARPRFPLKHIPQIQHRLAHAAGERWALLPHAYAFVDPLFSTGIAWGLRGVERIVSAFERAKPGTGVPDQETLIHYDALLAAEADQIDRLVAGAYQAMASFDLFAAHAMIYFALVSYSEVQQRFAPDDDWAWSGFLGVGDPIAEPLPVESLRRLHAIVGDNARIASHAERRDYVAWVEHAIAPRNIAGFADSARHNLYPVDLDVLVDRHSLLGLDREALIERLPLLRGLAGSA